MSKRSLSALSVGALLAALLLVAALSHQGVFSSGAEASADAGARPNFLIVMVDDQAMNSFRRDVQPETFSRLVDQGTAFTNSYATPPLCCPARAAFQTGQYPHNNGVLSNDYRLMRDPSNTLGQWLHDDGYYTGFVGKYMNKYEKAPGTAEGARPAPGYDDWWSFVNKPGYYDYTISDNGEVETIGDSPEEHSTAQITTQSLEFLDQAAEKDQPFFLWTSYYAPHLRSGGPVPNCVRKAPVPEPQDLEDWNSSRLPPTPAYNERDTADKPEEFSSRKRLSPSKRATILQRYRCTLQSMAGVDRGVAALDEALELHSMSRDTVVIYLSDNGFFFGEHRIAEGKVWPYDPSSQVPWAMRVPEEILGHSAPAVITEPVGTIDLAPTILEMAGTQPCVEDGDTQRCRVMDGRSLIALLRDREWRAPRDLLLQIGTECKGYASVRSERYLYGEYYSHGGAGQQVSGNDGTQGCRVADAELYDLWEDPYQLRNLLAERSLSSREKSLARAYHSRLEELRSCNGVSASESERHCR